MAGEDFNQEVFGTLANIMIGVQYIGILLIAGIALLVSVALPFPWFRRARLVLGILSLVGAAAIYIWLYLNVGG
jgi:hypothetical protein